MKNKILLGSAVLVGLATLVGVLGAALVNPTDHVTISKLTIIASILGTGSIGLFMVGLITPSEKRAVRSTVRRVAGKR